MIKHIENRISKCENNYSSMASFVLSINKMFFMLLVMTLIVTLNHNHTNADIAVISPMNRTVDVFIDIELGFAQPVPYDGMIGQVVMAHPEDACSKLSPPPSSNTTQKWFVLMRRPSCPLPTKVRYAMEAGYSAVIIYNIDLSSAKSKFSSTAYYPEAESGVTIPAVLISYDDGLTLKREYLYTHKFYVMIIPELPFNINAYLLPFAIVIGICLLLIISFMIFQIVKCVRDRRRLRKHRLSSRHLKKIPTIKYKKGDHYDTCAICLEEYIEGEKLRILPCGHGYHIKCIDPWLTKNRRVCPVCKGKVVLPGMSDDSDSESDSGHANTNGGNASERTPLLSRDRRSNRQVRQNRRRVRSFPQSTWRYNENRMEGAGTSTEAPEESGETQGTTLVSDNFSTSTPNVTIVEADVTVALAPNQHSLNCDHEREEAMIETSENSSNGTFRIPSTSSSTQRSSPRRSRNDIIV